MLALVAAVQQARVQALQVQVQVLARQVLARQVQQARLEPLRVLLPVVLASLVRSLELRLRRALRQRRRVAAIAAPERAVRLI